MHFRGNKSIVGDSLLSYFHSFRDQTCDVTITARSQRHSQYLSSAKRKGGETAGPTFRCPSLPILGECVSSLILPSTRQIMLSVEYLISISFRAHTLLRPLKWPRFSKREKFSHLKQISSFPYHFFFQFLRNWYRYFKDI